VVYAKRPFARPAAVLAYLSRYTHRVAIANSRLIALDDHEVAFQWKDYLAKGRCGYGRMILTVGEFMCRFPLYVLPRGVHRIRHYGLLANAARVENLARARALLETRPPPVLAIPERDADDSGVSAGPLDGRRSPCCGAAMVVIQTFARHHAPQVPPNARGASPLAGPAASPYLSHRRCSPRQAAMAPLCPRQPPGPSSAQHPGSQ
jgi:hypothetical protein